MGFIAQDVEKVEPMLVFTNKNDDYKNGADITIANLQKMAMPCTIEIVLEDGTKQSLQLPVETWMQSAVHTIHVETTQAFPGL